MGQYIRATFWFSRGRASGQAKYCIGITELELRFHRTSVRSASIHIVLEK